MRWSKRLCDIDVGKTEVLRLDPHVTLWIEWSDLHVVQFERELYPICRPVNLGMPRKHSTGLWITNVLAVFGAGDQLPLGIE